MTRVIGLVLGLFVLYGCVHLYVNHRELEAVLLSFLPLLLISSAFWPKTERPGAFFDWDVGPYGASVKLLYATLGGAFVAQYGYLIRGWLGAAVAVFLYILLTGFAIRRLIRRISAYRQWGELNLRIEHLPTATNPRLSGTIEVSGGRETLPHELRLSLVCNDLKRIDTSTVGSGGSGASTVDKKERWKEGRLFVVRSSGARHHVPFAFDIPAGLPLPIDPDGGNLPASLTLGKTYNEWHLRVEGDLQRIFVLPVITPVEP